MGNSGICLSNRNIDNEKVNTLKIITNQKEDEIVYSQNPYNDYYNPSQQTGNIIYNNYYTNSNNNYNYRNLKNKQKEKEKEETTNTNLNNNMSIHTKNNLNEQTQTELSPENNFVYLPLGDKYEGEILNNRPHGKGKYISSTGEIREGNFIKGKLISNFLKKIFLWKLNS